MLGVFVFTGTTDYSKSLEKKVWYPRKNHFPLKKVMTGGIKSLVIKLIKNTLEIKSNACRPCRSRGISYADIVVLTNYELMVSFYRQI